MNCDFNKVEACLPNDLVLHLVAHRYLRREYASWFGFAERIILHITAYSQVLNVLTSIMGQDSRFSDICLYDRIRNLHSGRPRRIHTHLRSIDQRKKVPDCNIQEESVRICLDRWRICSCSGQSSLLHRRLRASLTVCRFRALKHQEGLLCTDTGGLKISLC